MATVSSATAGNISMTMNALQVVYIISVTFQLTAGVLLLLGNTKITKKAIISRFCTQHRGVFVFPDGTLRDYEELDKMVEQFSRDVKVKVPDESRSYSYDECFWRSTRK